MKGWVLRNRRLPISFRIDYRVPPALLALAALTVVAMVFTLGTGEFPIPPRDVLRALLGRGTAEQDLIIVTFRLPRMLVAFLVGLGLALAGAILQGLTRNPLAAADVIGVSAGANLAAVTLIAFVPAAPAFLLPLGAFAGGLVATLLIYLLAWNRGSSPVRLVLVGIGIAAAAQALVTVVITAADFYVVNQAMIWLAGSVYGRTWAHVKLLLPWLGVFVPLALGLARHLDALHLGDDLARGLGARVEQQRGLLLLTSVALAGGAVAVAGNVGFIGLMAPHMARRLVGPLHRNLLPVAGLMGGLVATVADLLGRTLFAPVDVPVGVITAAVGAPYFIYLLYRTRRA